MTDQDPSPADLVSGGRHPSELELHRLVLGDLSPLRATPLEAHTAGCVTCGRALADLRAAHASFDRQVQPRTAPALLARSRISWPRLRRPLWLIPIPAVALVLLGVGLQNTGRGRWDGPAVRAKGPVHEGQPALELFVRRGEQVFGVVSGGELKPGDAVRFVVHHRAPLAHLLIVGVGAGGRVTVYHPFGDTASAPLPPGPGRIELAGSVVLDGSVGPERLFALFGRRPFQLQSVASALATVAQGGSQSLRTNRRLEGVEATIDDQTSILLERAGRR
jgi:hypothetical protein